MTFPNGPIAFQVNLSAEVANEIKALFQEASNAGLKEAFLESLRAVNERLKKDPDVFGEPRYTLKNLGIQVRIAILLPCVVTFGVNVASRKVFVSSFRMCGQGTQGA